MTCSCCETGRCCNGSTCRSITTSECAHRSGTFFSGGDCAPRACTSPAPYNSPCQIVDACVCAANGKVFWSAQASCDCNALTAHGVPYGGCQGYYCQRCDSGTGLCVYDCPSPRVCCAGTCCPESQSCNQTSGNCVNKCGAGTTYCNTTPSGGAYAYACCSSGTKCCGPSGCLSYTAQSGGALMSSDKSPGSDGWLDTNTDLTAADSLAITVTGTVPEGGGTATPDGKAGDCANANRFDTRFCYMAMLGKIGTTGTPFLVGSSYSGSPGAGRFYLRVNRAGYVFGPTAGGDFAVDYTRTTDPCPGYTPASVGDPVVFTTDGPPPAAGPGSDMKAILRVFGIVSSPTCSCNARAAQMDAWGEWESLKRLPEICGWLKEEADKREMWFFRPAGYALVLAAVLLSALKRPLRGNS